MKTHFLVLALSVLVGLIYASHHFFIPRFLDRENIYQPITLTSPHYEEAYLYGVRAHAVSEGDWIAGDIDLAGYEEGPALLPILNPIILGGLALIFGSLKSAIIASDFIFPPLIFIALYAIIFELTLRKIPSIIFASLFIFAPKLSIYLPPVTLLNAREALKGFIPFLDARDALYFSLFDEPKLTFLFFALGFFFALRGIKRGELRFSVLSGIFFGAMFYTYFYDWATFFAGIAISLVLFFIKKDRESMKHTLIILGTGILVSGYYWYNLWNLSLLPQYEDIILRIGYEESRAIRFATVWKTYARIFFLFYALWFFSWLWGRSEKRMLILMSGFLFSYYVAVNAQVITGFNPQPDHWYREQFLFFGIALFLITLWAYDAFLKKRLNHSELPIVAVFLVYFMGAQLYSEFLFSAANARGYSIPRARMEAYDWLRINTPKGSTVGAISIESNREISLYTDNNIYIPNGLTSTAPTEEVWDRYFFLASLYRLPPPRVREMLASGDLFYYLFSAQYQTTAFDSSFFPETRRMYPAELIDQKVSEYEERFIRNSANPPPYQLQYLYYGVNEENLGKDPLLIRPEIRKVFENSAARIYEL